MSPFPTRYCIEEVATGGVFAVAALDGTSTTNLDDAAKFDTWAEASDASQNYGPEFEVREI